MQYDFELFVKAVYVIALDSFLREGMGIRFNFS
jgi:hypothetical protein